MATLTVWPGLDRSGVSLVEYAEDGVTLIPAAGGAIVTYSDFYAQRIAAGRLCTSDPLALSGDAITVAPVSRVSSSVIGVLTTSLSARAGLSSEDVVATNGYYAARDGGGAQWYFSDLSSGLFADGVWVISCPNGFWSLSVDQYQYEVNIRHLGVTPSLSDCSARMQLVLDTAVTGMTDQTERLCSFYAPSGQYMFSTRLVVPPGTTTPFPTRRRFKIRGDGWMATADVYGSSLWTLPNRVGGTVFYFAPNTDGFYMYSNSADNSDYRWLFLEDMAVVCTGTGIGVNMVSALPSEGAGIFECNHVLVAGAKKGVVLNSYLCCKLDRLNTYGTDVGLQLGYTSGAGVAAATLIGYEGQRASTAAIDIQSAYSVVFVGGLLQSNANHIKFTGVSAVGAITFLGMHMETATGEIVLIDPTHDGGLKNFIGNTFGEAQQIEFHGNGWNWFCQTPPQMSYPGGSRGNLVVGGMPSSLLAAEGSEVQTIGVQSNGDSKPKIYQNATGAYTPDIMSDGKVHRWELVGNVTITLPNTQLPIGAEIELYFLQDATGGRTVTVNGATMGVAINNAGNAANTKLAVTYRNVSDVAGVTRWFQRAAQVGWV